jgi:hypothetical protein
MKMNKCSLFCLLAIASTAAAFTPISPLNKFAHATSSPSSIQSAHLSISPAKSSHRRNQSTSSTKMSMMAPAATGAGAMMGVVSGGILGGALHAIAGEFDVFSSCSLRVFE